MSKWSLKLLQILLLLFFLNFLSLIFYFLSHSSSQSPPHETQQKASLKPHSPNSRTDPTKLLKPWPILPSYLPWWTPPNQPRPPPRSCEAFFGNGFARRVELLARSGPVSGSGSGWFACRFSETLRSSVCEGGRVRLLPERVAMAAGGERLEDVIGRREEEELPEFGEGAVEVDGGEGVVERRGLVGLESLDEIMPEGQVLSHTMRRLVGSALVVPSKEFECNKWIEEPTLLVTRFEYANLFHTITDWYSAYVASRVTGLPNRPHLVFLDGHCKSQMEETWRALFSSVRYAKNFTGSVCFRHAVLVPLGYETALFKGLTDEIDCQGTSAQDLWRNPNDRKTARLSEFGEMIRASFHFPVNRRRAERPVSGFNVLFVRREDYLAHPRHRGKVESRLSNEEEVFDAMKTWASSNKECRINVVNGLFAHMSMKEQVRAIQEAHVVVGAHGAGLTHIVSALPKTVILEIISSMFRRPHFELIARWKGLEYHAINLEGSYAKAQVVIENLSDIMRGFGC